MDDANIIDMDDANIIDMIGQTMVSVTYSDNEEIVFVTDEGATYKLFHRQECCESVYIEDICGDINDLVGSPIVESEEVSNYDGPPTINDSDISYTWTFYKFRTAKGCVTVRWYGESNGYYSESVDFCVVTH